MIIKKKADVMHFLENFDYFTKTEGLKSYFAFDWYHNGTITLIQYPNNSFSYHRKCDLFWDIKEISPELKELKKLVWENRKFVNKAIKKAKCLTT